MACRSATRGAWFAGLLMVIGAAAAEDFEMLMLEVSINGQNPQPMLCLLDGEGGYWIEAAAADAARVNGRRPAALEHRGVSFLPVAGFEGAGASFDADTVSLAVTIPPRFIHSSVIAVRHDNYRQPRADFGAYADYEFTYLDPGGEDSEVFSAFFQPTLFSPAGFLRNAMIYRHGVFEDDDPLFPENQETTYEDGLVRLETTWVRDDPPNMRSLRVGDTILAPGSLGVASRFGGVQISTNFDTRPDLVTFPLPQMAGAAALQSSVQLFVDGRLSYEGSVDPGPFSFEEIPVATGAGQVQMITRDLTGREQVVLTDFYASPRILRRGLSEYSYSAGALRRDYGIESNDYGDAFLSGLHRYGVSDRLTIEGQGQVSAELGRLAGGMSWVSPRVGVTTVGLSYSHSDDGGAGVAWLVGHDYQTRRYRASFSIRGASEDYRQLNSDSSDSRLKLQYALGGGFNFARRSSVAASFARREYHDGEQFDFLSTSYSYSSGRNFSLFGFATYTDGESSDMTVGIGVTHFLGGSRSATYSARFGDDGAGLNAEMRSDLPVGPGYGYRFAAGSEDGDETWEADLSAQNRIGRVRLESDHDEEGMSWQASASGSAAWIGSMPFLAREIRDAFAVVKVNGFEGVTVYRDNLAVGKTDSSGRILIPGLRPFQDNRIGIEVQDLPLNARLDTLELSVTPYQSTGIVADFPAREARDVLFRMVMPDGSPAREGSVVRIDGRPDGAPVGLDGMVYLEDISGVQSGEVIWQGQGCRIRIDVPPTTDAVPDLGEVRCQSGD